MESISPVQLHDWLSNPTDAQGLAPLVLDVREAWEVDVARLPGAVHIPMNQIPQRLAEIDAGRPVVCVCHHGARSMQVALYLENQGVAPVFNLTGGVDAWSTAVDPHVARY